MAMHKMVKDDAEYWLLMYIDVIEYKKHHFLKAFHDVPEQFRRLLGPTIQAVKKQPGWCGQDPALVMAMIYFYFHTYFVIERLMHGNRHLGVSDEEAVERFIDILLYGLLAPVAKPSRRHPAEIAGNTGKIEQLRRATRPGCLAPKNN